MWYCIASNLVASDMEQQMSQQESCPVIATGDTDVVERPVEPDRHEVHVLPGVPVLGKRKFTRDLERMEVRRLNLECDKIRNENDRMVMAN